MNFRPFIESFAFNGKGFGILTAHNPKGKKLGRKENDSRNRDLWNELRAGGYDPWPVKGRYAGHAEDSFLVPDIGRKELLNFASDYDQEAVVWAEKKEKGYEVKIIKKGRTVENYHAANIKSVIARGV